MNTAPVRLEHATIGTVHALIRRTAVPALLASAFLCALPAARVSATAAPSTPPPTVHTTTTTTRKPLPASTLQGAWTVFGAGNSAELDDAGSNPVGSTTTLDATWYSNFHTVRSGQLNLHVNFALTHTEAGGTAPDQVTVQVRYRAPGTGWSNWDSYTVKVPAAAFGDQGSYAYALLPAGKSSAFEQYEVHLSETVLSAGEHDDTWDVNAS